MGRFVLPLLVVLALVLLAGALTLPRGAGEGPAATTRPEPPAPPGLARAGERGGAAGPALAERGRTGSEGALDPGTSPLHGPGADARSGEAAPEPPPLTAESAGEPAPPPPAPLPSPGADPEEPDSRERASACRADGDCSPGWVCCEAAGFACRPGARCGPRCRSDDDCSGERSEICCEEAGFQCLSLDSCRDETDCLPGLSCGGGRVCCLGPVAAHCVDPWTCPLASVACAADEDCQVHAPEASCCRDQDPPHCVPEGRACADGPGCLSDRDCWQAQGEVCCPAMQNRCVPRETCSAFAESCPEKPCDAGLVCCWGPLGAATCVLPDACL